MKKKNAMTPGGTAIGWTITLILLIVMLGNVGLVLVSVAVHLGAWLADVAHQSLQWTAMVVGTGGALLIGFGALISVAVVVGFGTALVVDRVRK